MSDSAAREVSRAWVLAYLVQGAVFVALAAWLADRWAPAAALGAACAAFQLAGAVAVAGWRSQRLAFWAAALTLAGTAAVVGFFFHAAWHLTVRFGPDAAQTGREARLAILAALPWVAGLPVAQLAATWRGLRSGLSATVLALAPLLFVPLAGRATTGPVEAWPEQPELVEAAQAAWTRWTGGEARLPTGEGPAVVLLTPWQGGKPGKTVRGDGPDLAAAVGQALGRLARADGVRPALVLDVARASYEDPLLRVGEGGGLGEAGGLSPSVAWRPGTPRFRDLVPLWRVPFVRLGDRAPTAFDSAVADASGARRLLQGWAEPPALSPEAVLEAIREAGLMIARNQEPGGRFAYEVKGPSGEYGPGYNFPRHAGAAWFLARAAARTGDPEIAQAADRAIAYMIEHTTDLRDGRGYVADARRKDTMVWVGTTALATLAALERHHEIAHAWAAFVASSVDERGQIRGNASQADGHFAPQPQNAYGHGQAILALAASVRAGDEAIRPALARAAAFVDGDYAPLGGSRLVVTDEHWSCLAASAVYDATGTPAGIGICRAYVSDLVANTPSRDRGVNPSAGSAGGGAEAVVALAFLEPERGWREKALAFGELFLQSAYRAGDAAFLERPERLLGGFRDSPFRLDVRVDAVQHIGCALLGIEALLTGEPRPGAKP